MTQHTFQLRQNLEAWIRKEIIDFDPYDEQDHSRQQPIASQAHSMERDYALTK
jgi:hypothetical protein